MNSNQTDASVSRVYPFVSKEQLQKLFGCKIRNEDIYQRAFVHKSALKELQGVITESYERLEFMGDSVINFLVTKYLFKTFPDQAEGYLTRIRTKLVSGSVLCQIAKQLGLQNLIIMNERGLTNGWNNNERILEDVLEALIGCLYLDVGILAAEQFVESLIRDFVSLEEVQKDNNYKDILMRYTQANGMSLPTYLSLDSVFDGKKVFEVHCWVNKLPCGYGRHKNKKQAEQKAAFQSLLYFNAISNDTSDEVDCFNVSG